jgi:hypothetical protein
MHVIENTAIKSPPGSAFVNFKVALSDLKHF